MSTLHVVHTDADAGVVGDVLCGLAHAGYLWWTSRTSPGDNSDGAGAAGRLAEQMRHCKAVLVMTSPLLEKATLAQDECAVAVQSGRPIVVIHGAHADGESTTMPSALSSRLMLPAIDWALEGQISGDVARRRLLTDMLPPGEPFDAVVSPGAQPVAWSESLFSLSLGDATRRHAHDSAAAMIEAFVAHLPLRTHLYPEDRLVADLNELRKERAFGLMCRLARAAIEHGARSDTVRRLFAQGLIEAHAFDDALKVLRGIVADPSASQAEIDEAHGLIGRTFKQQYMNAPEHAAAAALLRKAIDAYGAVYERDPRQFWHGVNAASCTLRAVRDSIPGVDPANARRIASQVATDLERLDSEEEPNVWELASRTEALIALDRFDEASSTLDTYLHHPKMHAFEVASTYRQFDQVLQLGSHPRGAALLDSLRTMVERTRGPHTPEPAHAAVDTGESAASAPAATVPLVIRVTHSTWQPRPDIALQIGARMGQVITAHGSTHAVQALLGDPDVISVEQSRPGGAVECARSMPFIGVAAEYPSAEGLFSEKGDRALVAIIDNGIDLLHHAFLDAQGGSRVLAVWDQRDPTGPSPAGFAYGTLHDGARIAGYIASGTVPPSLGRNPFGHGTHVASIAAGRPAGAFAGGVAQDAKLIVVISAGTGPIGYSKTHIEALAFIDAEATRRGLPVVVNLSQGMNAGAHDGKSALEVAFDAFSESGRRPGRVIVKSAGNERARAGHAKVTFGAPGADRLSWRRDPKAHGQERIELWWKGADQLSFKLVGPLSQNAVSAAVSIDEPTAKGLLGDNGPFRMQITQRHVDNGDNLLEVELGGPASSAAVGEWHLNIEAGKVVEGIEIHAWIERSGGEPTRFTNHIEEEMTLSVPATAASVIAVGAVEAINPMRVGDFSSYGPTRDGQDKPLVCAPGVRVVAANGGSADEVRSEDGTSMAAPHVAGAIALLLSRAEKAGRRLGANQIAAMLRQTTRDYNGRWERGRGYGLIQVAKLLAQRL